MISIKRKAITDTGMVWSVIWGTAAGIMISCIGALLGPLLILNEYTSPNTQPIITMIIQLFAGLGGTLVASALRKEGKIVSILICAGTIFLVMMSVGMLFFGANFSALMLGLTGNMSGAICSIIIINTQKQGGKKKRIKHRSR